MSLLELHDISKFYGEGETAVRALYEIDLSVDEGHLVAVMGPSGSGKSTLLTIAGSLEEPSGGEVRIDGAPLSRMSRNDKARLRRRSIGYVFQDFNLLPGLTAAENVALPLELDGVSARKAHQAGLAALERLGLADRAGHYPDQLSGGERQRVAIARSVVGERKLLLADEPSGALDSTNGEAVMAMIRDACDRGVAAIVVTHDAHLASWADRVVFLRDGRIVDHVVPDGPDSLLRSSPAGNAVAERTTPWRGHDEHRRPHTPRRHPARRWRRAGAPCRRPLGVAPLPARVASAVPDPRPHHGRGRGDDRRLGRRDEQPAAEERRLRYGAGLGVLHELQRAHRERHRQP